jgi:hypothetical protein
VPLTRLQTYALRMLAAQRSHDSYVAGGVALNRCGPRFSGDIDIFQDSEERLVTAAEADGACRASGAQSTRLAYPASICRAYHAF